MTTRRITLAEQAEAVSEIMSNGELNAQRKLHHDIFKAPIREVTQLIANDLGNGALIARANELVREHITRVINQYKELAHLPIASMPEDFIWTVKINDARNGLDFERMPAILQQLSTGQAPLNLYNPSEKDLKLLIDARIRRHTAANNAILKLTRNDIRLIRAVHPSFAERWDELMERCEIMACRSLTEMQAKVKFRRSDVRLIFQSNNGGQPVIYGLWMSGGLIPRDPLYYRPQVKKILATSLPDFDLDGVLIQCTAEGQSFGRLTVEDLEVSEND